MASNITLKVDGVKGQSMTTGHVDEIDCDSWSWSQAFMGVDITQSSGGTTGMGQCGELVVSKGFDIASAELAKRCILGQPIKEIVLTHTRGAGENMEEFCTLTLTHCVITSFQTSGHGGDKPQEGLSIAASHWNWKTKKQKDDGTTEEGPETEYNAKTGKAEKPS